MSQITAIGEVINNSPFQKTQSAVSTYDYVDNWVLFTNEKMKTVMIEYEGQLDGLRNESTGELLYPPGTIAYTPGFTNMWQLSTLGEWVPMLS